MPDEALPQAKKPALKEEQAEEQDGRAPKKDRVSDDKLLMAVSWEVGEKWEELGVALGLEYKVVQSVQSNAVQRPDHMKAFHMLQEWKNRSAFKATYTALAEALEGCGLNSCAQKHCYTDTYTAVKDE